MGVIAFLILIIKLQAQKPTTLIPQRIKIKSEISVKDSNNIEKLLDKTKKWGYQLKNEYYNDHVLAKDINGDGKHEYILKYYNGGANIIEEIYCVKNNKLISIGKFWENNYSFINSNTKYPDILVNYYDGHKTNPIWKYKILRFNGTKYEVYQSPNKTYGDLKDLGLNSYKKHNYPLAEIYFSNVLTIFGNTITDINNLSISLIKQGKNEKAEELLIKALKIKESDDTYYNLSLIYQNKKDTNQELSYLVKSNNLKKTDFKTKRINELKKIKK